MFDRRLRAELDVDVAVAEHAAPGKRPRTRERKAVLAPEAARVTSAMTELAIALGRKREVARAAEALRAVLVAGCTPELEKRARALLARADAVCLSLPVRGAFEAAIGMSLADVHVQVDDSLPVRAAAIGDEVRVRDASAVDDRELIAHEVAHVAQARLPTVGPVEAAEHEADDFAAAFVRGRAMSWRPTVGVRGRMHAPSRESQNATLDYRLTVARQDNANVNATSYVHMHLRELAGDALAFIGGHALDTGHPAVTFKTSAMPVVSDVLGALRGGDAMANVTRLREWLAPSDLLAVVDRVRPIYEAGDAVGGQPGDALDYGKGPKGPALYRPAVGLTIAAELERRLIESMARMSARLVGGNLVSAHPLDVHVGRALQAHCDVKPGATGEHVAYRKVKRLEWMGKRGGPWNSVRAVEPADANAEEIAAALTGKSTDAYRLEHLGGVYIVPSDIAGNFAEARESFVVEDANAARVRVAYGPLAAAAEMAEAGTVNATAPLALQWDRITEQLDAISTAVRPYQLDARLAAVRARHASHKDDLGRYAAVFEHQHQLLAELAAEIAPLVAQPKSPAIARALLGLVDVVAISHLAKSARAAYRALQSARHHELGDAIAGQLGRTNTQIDIIRKTSSVSAGASEPLQGRADALAMQAATLRSGLNSGALAPDSVAAFDLLIRRLESLELETRILAEIGELGMVANALEQLGGTTWMRITEEVSHTSGRLAMYAEAARRLQAILAVAHTQWMAIEAAARKHAAQLAHASPSDADLAAARAFRPALDAVRAKLDLLAGDREIAAFLKRAYNEIENAQIRQIIVELLAMIGIAIASGGLGEVAEGLAIGLGASESAAALVGVTVESVAFSGVQAALSEDPLATFAENFLGNLASFGATRFVKTLAAGSWVGKSLAAAKSGERVARLTLIAARIIDFSAPAIAAAAVQYLQAQANSLRATGHTLSFDDAKAMGVQAVAMLVGTVVAHKVLGGQLDDIKVWGAELGARHAQLAKLEALAVHVQETGDKAAALTLMHDARAYVEHGRAKWNDLRQLSDNELAARGLSRKLVDAMEQSSLAHRGALDTMEGDTLVAQLGLDTVMPGYEYAGTREDVTQVVELYEAKPGYRVTRAGNDVTVTRPDHTSFKLHTRADEVETLLRSASAFDRKQLERVLGLDAKQARALIKQYGNELVEYVHTNPVTTLEALSKALAKERKQKRDMTSGFYANTAHEPAGWHFATTGPITKRGTTTRVVTTEVRGPNAAEGTFERAYDPIAKRLELRAAFLRENGEEVELPRIVRHGGIEMIDQGGSPTVQYVTLHQMRLLGVPLGGHSADGIRTVHMSNIQNIETIVHLHYLRTTLGGDVSSLIEFTPSMRYAETTAVQTGYERSGPAVVSGGDEAPIARVMSFQEGKNQTRIDEHNDLLKKYGFTRNTKMLWRFDIDFPTRSPK